MLWYNPTLVKACYILFNIPLSLLPSLSYCSSFQSLLVSLTCYCYKSSNPVVTICKYRIFFFLFSNHKPEVPFTHLLGICGMNNFMCPVWKTSRTKSALSSVPTSRFHPWKCTELSRFCWAIFSLLLLPMAFIFFREGECRQFTANSCGSQSKATDCDIMKRCSKNFYVPFSLGLNGLGLSIVWTTNSLRMSTKIKLFSRLSPLVNSYSVSDLLSYWSILSSASSLHFWTHVVWDSFSEVFLPWKETKLCFFPSTGLTGKTAAMGWGH